jgi:hypothetical protein
MNPAMINAPEAGRRGASPNKPTGSGNSTNR